MGFDVEAVPAFLRERNQWVVWWLRDGTQKLPIARKFFADARRATKAKLSAIKKSFLGNVNSVDNHSAFNAAIEDAKFAYRAFEDKFGIGYAFANDDQVIAFDFDDVVKAGRLVSKEVDAFLSQLSTYVELSPSGTGVHAYCAVSPALKRRIIARAGSKTKFEVKALHDVFFASGYVTVTGKPLRPQCAEFNSEADAVVDRWFAHRYPGAFYTPTARAAKSPSTDIDDGGNDERVTALLEKIDADCDRDDWIHVGMVLHKMCNGDARGLKRWHDWSYTAPHRVPRPGEPSIDRLYASFDANTPHGLDLGTLVHMAQADRFERARLRLKRKIDFAAELFKTDELARERGVVVQETAATAGVHAVRLSAIKSEPTRWLWTNVIPFGHLTMVMGEVGANKSTMLLKLAADTTHMQRLEYDEHAAEHARRVALQYGEGSPETRPYERSGLVYYLTAEMHWEQSVRPAMEAANADLDRVFLVRSTFEPDKKRTKLMRRAFDFLSDMDKLVACFIEQRALPDLIVLDPLSSFVGHDLNRNTEGDVRMVLEMMADMCASLGIAFVCVVHQAKSTEHRGINKLLGSVAFGAVARVVLAIERVPLPAMKRAEGWEQETAFAVYAIKSNISPTQSEAYVFTADDDERYKRKVHFMERVDWAEYTRTYATVEDERGPRHTRSEKKKEIVQHVFDAIGTNPLCKLVDLCKGVAEVAEVSEEYVRQIVHSVAAFDKRTGWVRKDQ